MFEKIKILNIKNTIENVVEEIPNDCDFLNQKGIHITNNCFIWFIKVDEIVFVIKPKSIPNYCSSWLRYEDLLVGIQNNNSVSFSNNIDNYNIIFNLKSSGNKTLKIFIEKIKPHINKLNKALDDFKDYKNKEYQNRLNKL